MLNCGAYYYGKTGAGQHGRNIKAEATRKFLDGWYVGFIEKENKRYIFVSNITDKFSKKMNEFGDVIPTAGIESKAITIKLLNNYFSERQPSEVNEKK